MKKTSQLIFVDDSGDPGFKIAKGASRMFVITCIVFDDCVDAEFASASLKMLKKQWGWKQEREFKFHRANKEQKVAFFRLLKSLNFHVYAMIVDKTLVNKPRLKKDDSFYQKIILETLNNIDCMTNASIYLDGKAGKNYRNRSVPQIRRILNQKGQRMKQLKIVDSKDDILIQLADMIAGAIRIQNDPNKVDRKNLLHSIKGKLKNVEFYKND